ncbi:MAG: DegT/DnrJ/EryC1/StrS family aminotransferase [Thermoanaerobaculia bacterium]
MIPCSNPRAQYEAHRAEIDDAVARVLTNGRYILGPEVAAFEGEFAAYCDVEHAVGVASGTDALRIALEALGVQQGDEVITTAHTAVATVAAITSCGATPVFADIESRTYTIDPERVLAAVTPRTKAIVAVHLYGHPADLSPLLACGIPVIEDCAQAHGARYHGRRVGSLGVAGAFSFYPTKNLGAVGDGGMIVTHDPELARRMRLLREYGWAERYVSSTRGGNSRLDELQAAILRVKLRTLDRDNDRRRAIASRYDQHLSSAPVVTPHVAAGVEPVYHLYVIESESRDQLQQHLTGKGVNTLVHYPVPVHRQPAYATPANLPHTDRAAERVLSLPMYPELPPEDVDTVIRAVAEFQPRNR